MVKLSRILLFTVVLTMQDLADGFQSVIIVNNKQMTYNRNGELVEVDKVNEKKNNEVIMEKSNIFKSSAFVTNSNFQGGNSNFKSGLITKQSLEGNRYSPPMRATRPPPTRNYRLPTPPSPFPSITYFSSSTTETPTVATTFVLDDEISLIQNSLTNNYDEMYYQRYPVPTTKRPNPIESTHENPMIHFFSTPSPAVIIPLVASTTKKPKKKKKKKLTTTTTTPIPVQDHFLQNLDYYRKILAPNCTKNVNELHQVDDETTTEQIFVEITPKPKKKAKLKNEIKSDEIKGKKKGDKDKDKKKKKKKCKKEEDESHEYKHVHHYHEVDGGKHSKHKKHQIHQSNVIYYDPPLAHQFDKAGDLFDTFYSFFEDALTSKEFVDYDQHRGYYDDYSSSSYGSSYEDDSGGHGHHHKRVKKSTDAQLQKLADEARSPRKSMTTKITVTSEYDDSIPGQTTPTNPTGGQQLTEVNTKRPEKVKRPKSSEESDEYTLYDEIMNFRDDFDDSGDIDDDMKDSDEYYDDPPTNRLPKGETIEDYSDEHNDAQSPSFLENITGMIFSFGSFFTSLTGISDDTSRAPPIDDDYDDEYIVEGRSTTEKVERQSKRPKRENERLPWYQPSFLFASPNDDDKAFSSTTRRNWLDSPWQHMDDDDEETEIATEPPPTTSTVRSNKSSTDKPSLIEMLSQYFSPTETKLSGEQPTTVKLRRKKYDGYQLWRIYSTTKDDVNSIEDFKMSSEGLKVHWLKGPSTKGVADVVVSPDYIETFRDFLSDNSLKYHVKMRDIQHAIQFENPRLNKRDQIELAVVHGHPLSWYRYHPYKDILSYFDFLKRKFPDYVELIQIGWSFEGRPLSVVKISHPDHDENDVSRLPKEPRSASRKLTVFIQSGLDAHEWLPIACSTYILNSIITNIEGNDTMGDVLRRVDWYIMPVMNPDGYDYSMGYERLWTKTRSKHFPTTGFWSTV